MPIYPEKTSIIEYLRKYLNNNKARGMAAEIAITAEIDILGVKVGQKFLSGAWIVSPKNKYYLRYCSFVLPKLYENKNELLESIKEMQQNRTWQALATFLTTSHIGITVSGGVTDDMLGNLENIKWSNFVYQDETLHERENGEPFTLWDSGRGRSSTGKDWSDDVKNRYLQSNEKDLTELLMRQAFLEGYLKDSLKKSFGETYDVDGFIVGFSGRVLPLEIKEKSRTDKGEFGVDAGRILMLLRFCLMTDSNALYIIREVDTSENRHVIDWQYITLSDLIMKCKWNLQGGGRGMGGGSTQTIMMPGELFQVLKDENFSENWLTQYGSLHASVHATGKQIMNELQSYLDKNK